MSELTKEKLLEARGLIDLGWTMGTPFDPYTENADCYCLGGAIAKALWGNPFKMYDPEADAAFEEFVSLSGIPVRKYGGFDEDGNFDRDLGEPNWSESVYDFNDEHTKAEVLAVIDKAIRNLDPDKDVWAYLDGDTGEQS